MESADRTASRRIRAQSDDTALERPDPPVPGDIFEGKYLLRRLLGDGGSAWVYEAVHVEMKHRVAIKVVRPYEHDRTAGDRFRREMRISASVRHRNLLQVFDYGMYGQSPFLVMEYLDGRDLGHRLERGPLDPFEAIDVGCQLLSALAALASHGIVHRDVKPENVILCEEEGARLIKLVDFGIAQCPRQHDITGKLTIEGGITGTPHYMAPEQICAETLDARADVYGAGVLLYEGLAGRTPFDGDNAGALMTSVLRDPLPPIRTHRPDIPPALEAVVLRALARNREHRYGDPERMREALEQARQLLLSGEAPSERARGSTLPAATSRDLRRLGRVGRWAGGGLAAVALGAFVWGGLVWSEAERQTPDESTSSPVVDAPRSASPSSQTARSRAASAASTDEPDVAGTAEQAATPGRDEAADAAAADSQAGPERPARHARRDADRARRLQKRALAAYVQGESRRALALYRRSVRHARGYAPAWRGLGIVAADVGRTAEARSALKRYLALSPGARDASRIEGRLARLER